MTHGDKLYMSNNSHQRFAKILCKMLEDNEETLNAMGIGIDIIEAHSAQKDQQHIAPLVVLCTYQWYLSVYM